MALSNPNRGRELFASKGCSICHGEDTRGGQGGPNLGESDLHHSAGTIAGNMWNHAPIMREAILGEGRPWPELTGAELRNLYAFLASQPRDP